jgi:hypothetical protein
LFGLRRTIFGNTCNLLCETEKPAPLAGSQAANHYKIQANPEPRPYLSLPQDAEAVQSLWTPVRVVDNWPNPIPALSVGQL